MTISGTDLALTSSRVDCARVGAARVGFIPNFVDPEGVYNWVEQKPPTTQWTLLTEGPVCGKRPVASFTMSDETPAAPPIAAFNWTGPITGNPIWDVEFTDASTGDITSWSWDFGDTSSSTLQNPDHTYATSGPYTVTLTVTGPGGTDSDTQVIDMGV